MHRFAQVWIAIDAAARKTAEYRLAWRLLQDELGHDVATTVVEIDDLDAAAAMPADRRAAALDAAVRAWTGDAPSAEDIVLVIRDGWLVLAPGSLDALLRALAETRDLDCVMPLQPDCLPPDCSPDYQTPRGLLQFHHSVQQRMRASSAPPPGHRPALFAIRVGALREGLRTSDLCMLPQRLGARCAVTSLAYAHPLPAYHASDRADILPLVPGGTRTLLDIGCGAGAFAASVKRALGCRAVGVEMVPAIAHLAERRLDRVVIGDALTVQLAERFDCVTLLDSLEHLPEPDRLLARIAAEWLAPGGHLILSVPNVGHWSLVVDQLAGRWDYVPAGLLCETHLRFFTEESLRALLARHGFEVIALHRIALPAPAALSAQLSSLARAGFAVNACSLDTLAFHLVARHAG